MRAHDVQARARVIAGSANETNQGLAQKVMHAAAAAVGMVNGAGLGRRRIAAACHEFLRDVVSYRAEEEEQFVRMPWITVRQGVADCKSQAIYTAAMCAAEGCRVALRFVVLPGATHFGHVYTIVDGIPVDPLLAFGSECSYIAEETIPLNY